MEKYVFDLIAFLIGAALVGLVALLVNGLKSDIREMKEMLRGMVSETLCKERRESMEKDLNNLGDMVRGRQ